MIEQVLGWKPSTPLRVGIEKLYNWVKSEIDGKESVRKDSDLE